MRRVKKEGVFKSFKVGGGLPLLIRRVKMEDKGVYSQFFDKCTR